MPKTEPFDSYSDAYDEWFERNREIYEAELEAVRQLLPPTGARGVEIGVGSGKFAVPLGITIGVEPSEQMAVKAKKLGVTIYPGVAESLPLADEEYDFVLMVTTICFVDDISRSFSEAFRVLKPGGCIIVGFVDKDSGPGRQYQEKRNESRFYQDATFFSVQEVLDYLGDAGFGAVEIRQTLIPGEKTDVVKNGSGAGAFVVVRSEKLNH